MVRAQMVKSRVPQERNVGNAAWAEAIQLVPVISLALPFILAGRVDLERADWGFILGAALTLPTAAVVVARQQLLNPILVGTALWLWLGAVTFQFDLRGLHAWFIDTQAFGLFAASLVVGVVATFSSRHGFIACRGASKSWVRASSLRLLIVNTLVVGWAWWFREDIRIGGGLPFIALNLARRVMMRRAPAD
jgi:hypothetical protein